MQNDNVDGCHDLRLQLAKHWTQLYREQSIRSKQEQSIETLRLQIRQRMIQSSASITKYVKDDESISTTKQRLEELSIGQYTAQHGVQLYPFVDLNKQAQKDLQKHALLNRMTDQMYDQEIHIRGRVWSDIDIDDIVLYLQKNGVST